MHRVQNTTVSSSFHFDYSCHGNSQQENGTACFYFPLKSLSLFPSLGLLLFISRESFTRNTCVTHVKNPGRKQKEKSNTSFALFLFVRGYVYLHNKMMVMMTMMMLVQVKIGHMVLLLDYIVMQ